MDHSLNSQNQMSQAKNWDIVHPTKLATFLKIKFKIRQVLYKTEPAQRPAPTAFSPNTLCWRMLSHQHFWWHRMYTLWKTVNSYDPKNNSEKLEYVVLGIPKQFISFIFLFMYVQEIGLVKCQNIKWKLYVIRNDDMNSKTQGQTDHRHKTRMRSEPGPEEAEEARLIWWTRK